MADEPVSKEEADRIAAAKAAMYPPEVATAQPPTQDMLNQAAADQDSGTPDGPPVDAPATVPAALTPAAIVQAHVDAAIPPQEDHGPEWFTKNRTPSAPDEPSSFLTRLVAPPGPPVAQVTEADRRAQAREQFNPLDAAKTANADANIAARGQPGRAVLVSPGGMRPSTDAVKVEQGPQVPDADRLLKDQEGQSIASAVGTTAAEQTRDTQLAGLEALHSKADADFIKGERGAQQTQSDALAKVSDRMAQALSASNVPVVSPAADLNAMGMGQKLAFVLAAAGGGVAGRANGSNAFLDGYNQMVDQRINTQKQQVDQAKGQATGQENLYGVMKQGFQSDDAARTGMRVMYLEALKTKMNEAALHYGIDTANPRLQQMLAGVDQQILTEKLKLAEVSGKKISEEKVSKYAPPQVAVVGAPGISAKEVEARAKIHKSLNDEGLLDQKADLDRLDSELGALDKTGKIAHYAAAHPGMSLANAYFEMAGDPAQKQFIADVQGGLQSSIGVKGARSKIGQELSTAINNPEQAKEVYNRGAHDYAQRLPAAVEGSGAEDAWNVYRRQLADERDDRVSTNSPAQAVGAQSLPSAFAEPPQKGELPPAAAPASGVHPIVAAYNEREKKKRGESR